MHQTTAKGGDTRLRMIQVAADLFHRKGIHATSPDEIIEASRTGKGQFYHYFRSRDELVEAAVGLRCTQVLAQLGEALGSVESMAELASALAGFVRQFEQMGLPGCPIGTLATEVVESNEGARLHAAAAFDAWEKLFADALMRIRERGELRSDASPERLATALLASLEGGMMLSMTRKDPASMRIAMDAGLDQVQGFRT